MAARSTEAARPLRVLRVCSVFEPPTTALRGRGVAFDPIGGMQNHTAELTRALDRRGTTQVVLTTRPPTAAGEQRFGEHARVVRVGLPVPRCRQLWAVPAARRVRHLAAHADLIHAHLGEDLAVVPLAMLAARQRGAPLVLTIHTSLRYTLRGGHPRALLLRSLGAALEARGQQRADAVFTLTPRLANLLVDDGLPPERVHVIPSGVNRALFDRAQPDPFPDLPGRRVGFVGRLAPQKGVQVLLEAAALLQTPNVQVLLVGDGPDRARLEREITARRLGQRVHITGFLPHDRIPAVLAHLDVFVMPSVYEELGSAIIEAMYAGLPIIATRVGGIPDVIDDGRTGVLVPSGDAVAWARAIDTLLIDRPAAGRLAEAARRAADAYDWDTLAGRVHDIYRHLVRA